MTNPPYPIPAIFEKSHPPPILKGVGVMFRLCFIYTQHGCSYIRSIILFEIFYNDSEINFFLLENVSQCYVFI